MAMTEREPFEDDLDAAFADLKAQAPRPDAALLGRVLADAAAVQSSHRLGWRWVAGWFRGLGGGQGASAVVSRGTAGAAAGLAGSLMLGVWIGVSLHGVIAPLEALQWSEAMVLALGDPALVLAE